MAAIDLNSDLGESYGIWRLGDDESMLDLVTSANIACGFHAGDPSTLRRVCLAAAERHVTIGAQVSYPDLLGFGRRFIDIDPGELRDAVLYQLGALDGFAQVAGAGVGYVKPHGALYHACISHPEQAEAVVAAAHEYDPAMAVLGSPGSPLLDVADAMGMEPVGEAFADRAYLDDGRLVPWTEPGSVIVDPVAVAARAVQIAVDRTVTTIDGQPIDVDARSICIHGDTPGAVELGRAVRAALAAAVHRGPRVRGVTMRVLPMGPTAVLVDDPGPDPAGWSLGLRTLAPRGLVDVVPGAASVLVVCESPAALQSAVAQFERVDADAGAGRAGRAEVLIDVAYDGPDLQAVGAETGLSIDEVIEAHSGAVFEVAFCGFSPGFAYLRGLPTPLHLPRRATPRTRAPAGSVAIADEYGAVYPSDSPGGWHLLGHTTARLFDVDDDPPALLAPGDRVRFRPR